MTRAPGTEVARKEGGGEERGEGRKAGKMDARVPPVSNHSNNSVPVLVARAVVSLAGFFSWSL